MGVCPYSCICYSAFRAGLFHAEFYSHVRPAWFYHIFAHYLRSGTIFEKKRKYCTEHKIVFFIFTATFICNISHPKKNRARYYHECTVHSSLCKVLLVLSVFAKFELPRLIFKKSSNIRFHENPSSGNRVVPCGQTDMTQLTVADRNFANATKMLKKKQITSDTAWTAVKGIAGPCA